MSVDPRHEVLIGELFNADGSPFRREQYGSSIHYPDCRDRSCTGCLEHVTHACTVRLDLPPGPLEGSALGVTDEQRNDPAKLFADWMGR